MSNKTVLILRESVLQSIIKDACTFLVTVAILGVGYVFGSQAMQWVGFVMLFVFMLGRFSNYKDKFKTPQEAADLLYSKYGVKAKD